MLSKTERTEVFSSVVAGDDHADAAVFIPDEVGVTPGLGRFVVVPQAGDERVGSG